MEFVPKGYRRGTTLSHIPSGQKVSNERFLGKPEFVP